jgi:hypothetical protein
MAVRLTGFLAFAALALSACQTPPAPSAWQGIAARVSIVAIAPLNLAIRTPDELKGKGEPVWEQLQQHFQILDKQVALVAPLRAERLWFEAHIDLDYSDRTRALQVAHARFAQALAEIRSYDLLVVPSLVLRPARLRSGYASWDGVRRVVARGLQVIDPGFSDLFHPSGGPVSSGLRGKIGAASLHVAVLRPDGTRVYEGLGGLDLVQELHRDDPWGGRWTFEPRAEPFADAGHVREGVQRALDGTIQTARRGY